MDYGKTPQTTEIPVQNNDNEQNLAKNYFLMHKIGSRIIATVAIAGDLYMAGYRLPVTLEEQRLSETHPAIIETATNEQHLAAETIIAGGFGIRSAVPIAEALSPLDKIGSVFALEQDNEGVDPNVIAEKIIEQASSHGLTEIGLWGDSIGGPLFVKVGRIIQESNAYVRVRFIVLESSPTGFDSLRPSEQNALQTLQFASSILPDIAKHPVASYLYNQQKLNNSPIIGGRFGVGTVINEMYRSDRPSASLLASQALANLHITLQDDFNAIADVDDKKPPIIFIINPSDNNSDKTVNTEKSRNDETRILEESGLTYVSIDMPSISHGDPSVDQKQYRDMLNKILIPAVKLYDQSIGTRLTTPDRP